MPTKGKSSQRSPRVLLLTGPPAAGKNTIARLLSAKRKRCAVVDVDVLRWMVLQPHKAPWAGEEGRAQHLLGIRNASIIAKQFVESGFDTIVLDVISDETIAAYRRELHPLQFTTVLLLPGYEEVKRRSTLRPPALTAEEMKRLYASQTRFESFDKKIDNSSLSAEEVAEMLNQMFDLGDT